MNPLNPERRSAVAGGEPKESQHELHDKNPVKPAKFSVLCTRQVAMFTESPGRPGSTGSLRFAGEGLWGVHFFVTLLRTILASASLQMVPPVRREGAANSNYVGTVF